VMDLGKRKILVRIAGIFPGGVGLSKRGVGGTK